MSALRIPLACAAMAIAIVAHAQIPAATLAQANADLQAGQADKALALLTPLPTTGAGADQAQNLLCRVRFTLQQWSQAAAECRQASTPRCGRRFRRESSRRLSSMATSTSA